MRILLTVLNYLLSGSLGYLIASAATEHRISWAAAIALLVTTVLVVGISFGLLQAMLGRAK